MEARTERKAVNTIGWVFLVTRSANLQTKRVRIPMVLGAITKECCRFESCRFQLRPENAGVTQGKERPSRCWFDSNTGHHNTDEMHAERLDLAADKVKKPACTSKFNIDEMHTEKRLNMYCKYCSLKCIASDCDCLCHNFFENVEITATCWMWKGNAIETHKNKYGVFYRSPRKRVLAHRYSYELSKGDIPKDKVIDHLCRNGLCVNPAHLEAVSNKENILRGVGTPANNKRKTECHKGHKLSGKNIRIRTDGRRICIICEKEYNRKRPKRDWSKLSRGKFRK